MDDGSLVSDVVGDVEQLGRLLADQPLQPVDVVDTGRPMPSAFDVDRLIGASAAYCTATANGPARQLDLAHVRSFCTTHVEVDGSPVPAWADLSGVYPTVDGRHLQVHCNFPHHAAGVVRLLGVEPERAAVAAAIADRDALALETELIEAGLIGAAVRTLDEWSDHPHARATADLPLVRVERVDDAEPDAATRHRDRSMRVLDCSRVLAGPVAGQMLAAFGGDVIRLGAPHLPSVEVGVISTGFGKRNAFADLRTTAGRDAMDALLAGADVWIDAYRPGALSGHGITAERAAELRPGIVIVQISAFDRIGPWADRRGYDSIVQSTTGLRWAGGELAVDDRGRPTGADPIGQPVQALDYATGFLAAGVAMQLVRRQRTVGGSWLARLSLLRTRNRLVSMGGPHPYVPATVTAEPRHLHTVDAEFGRVTAVTPFAGDLRHPPRRLGTSEPVW